MATIRKRGSSWQVQIRRTDSPTQTKTFRLKTKAIAWSRQTEANLDQGIIHCNPSRLNQVTVGDLLERYRNEVSCFKKSAAQEYGAVDLLLRDPLAEIRLSKISPSDFAQFRDKRLSQVKPSTVLRQLSILQNAFNVAMREWEWPITKNPVACIRKPKIIDRRERRIREGELEKIWDGCNQLNTNWLRPLIEFAIETGMRRGEIVSLEWRDVDLNKCTAYLRDTKNGHPRAVPLTKRAIEILENLDHKHDRVFPETGNAVRLAWARLRKRIGIEDFRFHDLRHEAISRFFELGLSLPEVALISGHKDYRMLLRYTHLKPATVVERLRTATRPKKRKRNYVQIPNKLTTPPETIFADIQAVSKVRPKTTPSIDQRRKRRCVYQYRREVDEHLHSRFGITTTQSEVPFINHAFGENLPCAELVEIFKARFQLKNLSEEPGNSS